MKGSSGGWRDGNYAVMFNGVVFEIQFAISDMVKARKGLEAHKSYAQFRSLFELFALLGLELELEAGSEEDAAAGSGSEGDAAAVAALKAEIAALKAENAEIPALKAEVARLKAESNSGSSCCAIA